ncbi:alpha-glucosidase [Stereum hirsutum FP-91666 SS1]|uniref:alpha-glucosidase n=1 Tax=Stereum hirsutum (strain FP-91666) TaxID=721885 RepID=UPI000444994F|nr:alpha-glucosidase [Stereum hirsutum FP-91666 SS1]EIM82359.1 alpha-glucosidase [Stereum hirsutum FP-91666 SS1]
MTLRMRLARFLVLSGLFFGFASAEWVDPAVLDACPGYSATNISISGTKLTAGLVLAGTACNVFGNDSQTLSLEVTYETTSRIHVKITDPNTVRYEVPESVLPRPSANDSVSLSDAQIKFNYTESPFSFAIYRTSTEEVLFSTASHPIIFEPQYLRLKTSLPLSANIYGLGEHTDSFRLDPTNTTRTFWSRDAYGVPTDTNLYGNHPIYFEHRTTGTHGVFLLNSNGMDIKIVEDEDSGSLEYNVIGGVLDLYFLAGSESDPTEVARQYAEVVGTPAEVPYWSFGLHQCRFGYQNFVDVADVITNYSAAGIPLETMWTDIDYMYKRRIFTNDPDYFPTDKMREIISYLHDHDQKFILMTDPAVGYLPGDDYGPYDRGTEMDVWIKAPNGSASLGLVWPGVTVYPDWFHPNISDYWTNEFAMFYNPDTGLDIDGAWIDMNEPSSFCTYPCDDPFEQAREQDLPPNRTTAAPDPSTPIFDDYTSNVTLKRRDFPIPSHDGEDVLIPPYAIDNAAVTLSNKTGYTDASHANGLLEYDTHNIYGTMMSTATHEAMLARRPGLRTLVITRSTFAGAGTKVGKWLGDNFSDWDHYRNSIAGILGFASVYQIPEVGADVCGYAENTTETLCARWATLGGFYPFFRNHNADTSISQEFYRWPLTTAAAKNVLDIRYRLLDYIYTAMHTASVVGTPILHPLFFKYPSDSSTYPIDLQFFFGDSLLVSPVTEENSTSVTIYLPSDTFYNFTTFEPIVGNASNITLTDIGFDQIPVFIKGGAILPLREMSAMLTSEVRAIDFEFVVAPSTTTSAGNRTAVGSLYVDDGESISPNATTTVNMTYGNNKLSVVGDFGYDVGVKVARVLVLGVEAKPGTVSVALSGGSSNTTEWSWDKDKMVLNVTLGFALDTGFEVEFD